ncbi:hypothetical protein [Sphingomonas koreensis]
MPANLPTHVPGTISGDDMRFTEYGAELLLGAARAALGEIDRAVAPLRGDRPGLRLRGVSKLDALLGPAGELGKLIAPFAGAAALLIAPGSHRFGLVREEAIDAVVAQCGVRACIARAGDIWVYATSILHASEVARLPKARRVLQVDYAGFDLPGGLEWSGI